MRRNDKTIISVFDRKCWTAYTFMHVYEDKKKTNKKKNFHHSQMKHFKQIRITDVTERYKVRMTLTDSSDTAFIKFQFFFQN